MAETIKSLQAKLSKMTTDWLEDGSHPPNYIRKTGMGEEIANVDRWCGGYQNTHEPLTIGWRARNGNKVMSGVVPVNYTLGLSKQACINIAINKAKQLTTNALVQLGRRL